MPVVVDYADVLQRMRSEGLRSLYYNSGAFGFAEGADVKTAGWVTREDESIRAELRASLRIVAEPHEQNLARLLRLAWEKHIATRLWLMPMSHWAYELQFGNREWFVPLLDESGIDTSALQNLPNAAAVEFALEEHALLESFIARMLQMIHGSDFMLAFPSQPVLCTLHHHKQLWWQTIDPQLHSVLEKLPQSIQSPSS